MSLYGEGDKTAIIVTGIEVIQQLTSQIGAPIAYDLYKK